ncbi:MAG: hypothetical protein ACREUC_10660, partial [Steroidobacteraceae bacterium]
TKTSASRGRGEELARKVVGVGALTANEGRTVTLSVDVFTPVVQEPARDKVTEKTPPKKQ